jgi:hypothetical protein
MKRLIFDAADVRRVVEHSIAAKTQMRSARRPAAADEDAPAPAVVFGHDRGVYLMSNGEPPDLIERTLRFVAYARGCDPTGDADWRKNSRELVGEDDFSTTMPWANDLKVLVDAGVQMLVLNFNRDGDHLEVEIGSDA